MEQINVVTGNGSLVCLENKGVIDMYFFFLSGKEVWNRKRQVSLEPRDVEALSKRTGLSSGLPAFCGEAK